MAASSPLEHACLTSGAGERPSAEERRRSMSEHAFLEKQRGLIGLPKSF
jgi:hypothetical protein